MLLAAQQNIAEHITFGIIAFGMIVGALRVVTTNNLVHAALWLVVVLGGAAAIYLLLAAEFVAVTQILVYIGAVTVLFLFGTMLTRARIGREEGLNTPNTALAVVTGLVIAGVLAWVLVDAFHADELPANPVITTTQQVSDSIFGTYLIPFWVLSFVLLAAVIGAIVLARKD